MTDRSTRATGFRWECPFCGTRRLNASADESGEENAIAALRSHVLASDGDGHGPRNQYPADFDPATLSEHVVRSDDRADGFDRPSYGEGRQ